MYTHTEVCRLFFVQHTRAVRVDQTRRGHRQRVIAFFTRASHFGRVHTETRSWVDCVWALERHNNVLFGVRAVTRIHNQCEAVKVPLAIAL